MNITVNYKSLTLCAVCATVAVATATGTIDKYIAFAGELNAAAFFLISGMMTIMTAAASFEVNN